MRTILIADEDVDTRFVSLFSDMDYRIVTTSSGMDAISKAREIKPDIVLVDVSLSDKDGYEVSREIKNNLLLKDTPVILLTSSLGTFDEIRAAEARADDFIIKPFKFEEITKKIEELKQEEKRKYQEQISTSDPRFADIEMIAIKKELEGGSEKEADKKAKYTSPWVYVTVGGLTALVLLIVGLTWKWNNLKHQRQEEEVRQEVEAGKGAGTTRQRIKDRYVQLAEASKQKEKWAEAEGYYEEALTIDSKDEILMAALRQVKERRRAKEETARRKAETMARRAEEARQSAQPLTQAKKQISANRFTAPAGNNAQKTHREVLRVAPKHKEALEDTKKNKDRYVRSAEEGDANAMAYLGYMYEKGVGVEKSYDEAVRWYSKAAEAENTRAMVILGLMYTEGLKVKRDYAEAVKWDRRAAEAGIASAMTNLGYMYIEGFGVKKDYAEAVYWYRKGAEAGNAEAMTNLGDMYKGGIGVEKSYDEAVRWYSKAASLGDEDAKSALKKLGK